MIVDLVFEGGGAKGAVFVGALETFFSRGLSFGRLLGTSAGAISATLLAAGYSVEEMLKALSESDADGDHVFSNFMGQPTPFTMQEIAESSLRSLLREVNLTIVPDLAEEKIDNAITTALMKAPLFRNLFALIERGGWYSADAFITWLQHKLDALRPSGEARNYSGMTLKQFYIATKTDLSLVATDTTDYQLLILNHRTAPDCPLVYAVRMSMSIPLLWEEVEWQTDWGLYRNHKMTSHAIVDGGLLSNFPLELFVSNAPQVTAVMGDKEVEHVLGLIIDESIPVPDAPERPEEDEPSLLMPLGKLKTIRRLRNLVNTMTQAHDKSVIDAFAHLVVHLPAGGYDTTEFDMTPERRTALVDAGRRVMAEFLDNSPALRLVEDLPALHFTGTFESSSPATQIADRVALKILGD